MSEHERIWLEPAGAPDRTWCQDNVWGDDGVEYVRAEQMGRLDRPALVGSVVFRRGVSISTVVEAAQRLYAAETTLPPPQMVGGQALRLVVEYDDLLRKYTGPIAGMTDRDNAAIDAAYDKMVAAARAAVEARPAPAQHMVGYREGFEAALEQAAKLADTKSEEASYEAKALRKINDYARAKQLSLESFACASIASALRALATATEGSGE